MRSEHQRVVVAIGAVVGLGLVLEGLRPTGSTPVDAALLIVVGATMVWACATAPWWALVVLAATAAALAPPWLPLIIGLGVLALSLAVGAMKRSQPLERAVVAGGAMLVLSMGRDMWQFGVGSLIGVAVVLVVAALGVWRKTGRERRRAAWTAAGVAAAALVAMAGLAAAGSSARGDLSEGNDTARAGLQLLERGEFAAAEAQFEQAAASFERAGDALNAPWAQPARLVPVAAQHREAGVELSWSAAEASRTIAEQVRQVDLNSLRVVGGRIDLDAVRALSAPMAEMQSALGDLDEAVQEADSDWLIAPVADRLDDLEADLDEQRDLGDKALAALAVAPAMLGDDGERVYFVMFTTPAEVRGQGGFMGNYAELTVDQGRIAMTAFGRHSDLNRAIEHPVVLEQAPEDWLDMYGQFSFRMGNAGEVGRDPWSMITQSPNFPATASVVNELYPHSGGRELDGVFSIDVFVMEALVDLVGPLEIEGAPEPLTGENTAEFLLLDQYLAVEDQESNLQRQDMLESVAFEVVNRLLLDAPDPLDFGRAMAPFPDERRLYGWAPAPAEQQVLVDAGMDGELFADLDGAPGVMVTLNNAGGSKIDSFLDEQLTVAGDELRLTLTNNAPAGGYPDYVIGNSSGLPDGTAKYRVTAFATEPIGKAALDGVPLATSASTENGAHAAAAFVNVAPGATRTVTFQLPNAAIATVVEQPLAQRQSALR